jgi:small GTP-binding protein
MASYLESSDNMTAKKIVLIGDFSTGKTSLIRRFVDNSFSDDYLSTIGVKVSVKAIETPKGTVRGLIWDIEGGTETLPINETYLKGAHGGIVVADLTRKESIDNIAQYIATARNNAEGIELVVALNKVDLCDREEAEARRDEVAALHADTLETFLTSAKTGESVETMFAVLAERLLKA